VDRGVIERGVETPFVLYFFCIFILFWQEEDFYCEIGGKRISIEYLMSLQQGICPCVSSASTDVSGQAREMNCLLERKGTIDPSQPLHGFCSLLFEVRQLAHLTESDARA
jgi:hypothetical protein